MSVTARVVSALALLLVARTPGHAQALFTLPGDVRVVEVDDAAGRLVGTDVHGFVWEYGAGGLVCFDPADRAGSERVFGAFDHPGIANGDVWVDPTWDGAISYEGLYTPNPDFEPGGPQLLFQPYTCTTTPPLPAPWRVGLQPIAGYHVAGATGAWARERVFLRVGDLCAMQSFQADTYRDPRPIGRILCVDFPMGGTPTATILLAEGGLDARLGVPAWESTFPGQPFIIRYAFPGDLGQSYTGPPFEGWRFSTPVVTTDQRVFFLATRQTAVFTPASGGGYGYPRWLLELRADGTVSPRLSPDVIRDGGQSPLAEGMWWHGTTRALLIAPDGPREFGNYEQCGGDGFGNLVCSPHGPGGMGFYYVPIDEPGLGYFSIRDAYARGARCRHDAAHEACTLYAPSVASDATGRLVFHVIQREYNQPDALGPWKDVVDTTRHFRLDFDPSAFDMDGDGLTRADEDALGTSDYDVDSDRGYTFDAVEAGVLATDPARPDDDVARIDQNLVVEPSGYGTSRLVRAWIPQEVSDYYLSRIESLTADAPLCFRGACLDVHAREVMRFPTDEGLTDHKVSADGDFLAWRHGTAIERKRFAGETGDAPRDAADGVESWVTAGELERFIGASPPRGQLYPISRDLGYWVQGASPPVVIAFDGAGRGSLAFDLLDAACDSELGSCAPEPISDTFVGALDALDEVFAELWPVGYHAATGRLLVGARTNWRQFLIALEAGRPPVVLDARSAATVFPDWFTPTGHGHDYVENAAVAALLSPDLAFSGTTIEGFGVWTVGSPRSYWGDVTLVQAWTGRSLGDELPEGVLEAVWFPPEVAPGETLAFDPEGAMLSRIGLRGGAVDAWARPDASEHGVSGIDVTADLRLCAANPRAGRVREYLPRFGRAAPSVTEDPDIVMPHAIDCAYGEDGALRVLVSDPPAVWLRAPGTSTFVVDAAIAVPPSPRRFVRGPGPGGRGFAEVIGADDDAAGRVITRAGVVVDIPKGTWNLRWNGVVVANLRNTVYWFGSDPRNQNFNLEIPGDMAMVERADGRIVMSMLGGGENMHPGPFIYEPRSGKVLRAEEGTTYGRLLAVVPGGESVDPWTGDRLGPPVPASVTGPSGPTATPAPSGGTPIPTTGADEGCAGGPGGQSFALVLLALTIRRRSRTSD